jgi:hypothetical protein
MTESSAAASVLNALAVLDAEVMSREAEHQRVLDENRELQVRVVELTEQIRQLKEEK